MKSGDLKMSECTFFGKIMDLIDREANGARPRQHLTLFEIWWELWQN
jgi:hypothetical protein